MTTVASSWLSRLLITLAGSVLTACSIAPGLTMSAARTAQAPSGNGVPLPQWIRAYEPAPDGQGGQAGRDQPPVGTLFPITPALIRMQRGQPASDVAQDVKRLFGVAKPYTIGPGDVLNIVVWDHPELSQAAGGGFNVSREGAIQFPFVGELKIGGLTESQARAQLAARLAKVIKNPEVTLRIQAYRSGRVYVEGAVRQTGPQTIDDIPLTLPEAISRAGGFSPTADRSNVAITRGNSTTLINLLQLAQLGVNAGNILLAAGDVVQVSSFEDGKVFVLGEVMRTGALALRNGRMTLNGALGESGGISQISGDPRQIYVLRNGGGGHAEIYHLDARTPAAYALTEGFDLKASDIVFVDPSPLVRWNRVISLLLPSAGAVTLTRDTSNAFKP